MLITAVRHNDSNAVHTLLAHGASPNAWESSEEASLVSAALSFVMHRPTGQRVLFSSLGVNWLEYGGGWTSMKSTVNPDIVAALVADGANVDERDHYGLTPLMYACIAGRGDYVAVLLRYKANVNARSQTGVTALMCCSAMPGGVAIARRLIGVGAHVNARDTAGRSVLMYAASLGNVDLVRVLLDNHADKTA
jgi:ankyrin repeat protein